MTPEQLQMDVLIEEIFDPEDGYTPVYYNVASIELYHDEALDEVDPYLEEGQPFFRV